MLRLVPLDRPAIDDHEAAAFRRLVVRLFGFRRKQAIRGLRELTGWPTPQVERVLAVAGIEAKLRPEVLSPELFTRLLRALVDGGWSAR